MAGHDVPSHIDRVFADGRLVDEAVEAAAQDAIDRHRDAGRPVVIARDGRPVEVPVSALSQDQPGHEPEDPGTILTDTELSKERAPKELGDWVDDRLAAIRRRERTGTASPGAVQALLRGDVCLSALRPTPVRRTR